MFLHMYLQVGPHRVRLDCLALQCKPTASDKLQFNGFCSKCQAPGVCSSVARRRTRLWAGPSFLIWGCPDLDTVQHVTSDML